MEKTVENEKRNGKVCQGILMLRTCKEAARSSAGVYGCSLNWLSILTQQSELVKMECVKRNQSGANNTIFSEVS